MNTPNPLIPQGTFPDTRGRSHIRIAVFTILAIHVVLLGALLMAGCKKTAEPDGGLDGKGLAGTYTNTSLPPEPPAIGTLSGSTTSTVTPPTGAITGLIPPTPGPGPGSIVPPEPPPPPPAPGTDHVVVKGDSFFTIAKKYGVTTKAMAEANPGVDSTRLKIGQKLKVPASSGAPGGATSHGASGNGLSAGSEKTYTVKSGDNLMKIAKANGTSLKALRSANGLKTDQIKVGQKLKIPSKAPTPDTASTSGVPATSSASALPVSPP